MKACMIKRSGLQFSWIVTSKSKSFEKMAESTTLTTEWARMLRIESQTCDDVAHVLVRATLNSRGLMAQFILIDGEFPEAACTLSMENERGDTHISWTSPLQPLSLPEEGRARALRQCMAFPIESMEVCNMSTLRNISDSDGNQDDNQVSMKFSFKIMISLGGHHDAPDDDEEDDDDNG